MSASNSTNRIVTIYTDGACDPNPGPGGWAAILLFGTHRKEIYGNVEKTTNNRMELQATIEALRYLKSSSVVELYTDSEYIQKGITKWMTMWQARGWRTSKKRPVANQDLWLELVSVMKQHEVVWKWVKGHSGNPLNEEVDTLARKSISSINQNNVRDSIRAFTGASCIGTTGPGGWTVLLLQNQAVKVLSGQEKITTANRMQLFSAAQAMKSAPIAKPLDIYTTSKYVHQGASNWLSNWRTQDWKTKSGDTVKNLDMWKPISLDIDRLDINWHLCSSNKPIPEMDAAHYLAKNAALGSTNDELRKLLETKYQI
tara:strand:- start:17195 stop:18136 length:942 start_codon:yes stop_codon:yes gene_type:complete